MNRVLRKGILLMLIISIFLASSLSVFAATCSIENVGTGTCSKSGNFEVLRMSDKTNAHVAMPNKAALLTTAIGKNIGYYDIPTSNTGFTHALCCPGVIASKKQVTTKDFLISLSSIDNGHASKQEKYYSNNVYLFSAINIASCSVSSGSCTIGSAILSLSSDNNAHVGGPNDYNTKVCCSFQSASPQEPKTDLPVGSLCKSKEECRAGLYCQGGVCVNSCKNFGEQDLKNCKGNPQEPWCGEDGFCGCPNLDKAKGEENCKEWTKNKYGSCGLDRWCGGLGAKCEVDEQCLSGKCKNKNCTAPTKKKAAGTKFGGQACTSGSECKSGECIREKCAGLMGDACVNSKCKTGLLCINNKCVSSGKCQLANALWYDVVGESKLNKINLNKTKPGDMLKAYLYVNASGNCENKVVDFEIYYIDSNIVKKFVESIENVTIYSTSATTYGAINKSAITLWKNMNNSKVLKDMFKKGSKFAFVAKVRPSKGILKKSSVYTSLVIAPLKNLSPPAGYESILGSDNLELSALTCKPDPINTKIKKLAEDACKKLNAASLIGQDKNCNGKDDCYEFLVALKKQQQKKKGTPSKNLWGGYGSLSNYVNKVCYWNCKDASWGTCDAKSKTKKRSIGDCTIGTSMSLPASCKCSLAPNIKSCLPPIGLPKTSAACVPEQKEFPFFSGWNIIFVIFLLFGYYIYKGKN